MDLATDASTSELSQKDDLLIALTTCWTLYHLNNIERGNAYWAIFKSMVQESINSQNTKPDLYQSVDSMKPATNTSYWTDPFVRSITNG